MRLLVLVSDAFGGRGGIAKFNRDLLAALCAYPDSDEVVALPRLIPETPGPLPKGLHYMQEAAGGKATYARVLMQYLLSGTKIDGVICGHVNLLPLAWLAARWKRVPLLLVIHGIDAWQPTPSRVSNRLVQKVDAFVAVSAYTSDRFLAWTGLRAAQGHVIPNCIDVSGYGPGPKPAYLLDRYGLHGRTVLMTLGRLSAEEQYKGHDEVLDVLPALARKLPDISYLICGDGDDRARLEAKAVALGLDERVVFAGYVAEAEKADHYRLADAFVMPGRGEGFGIAYLEALACGIPVVASSADASREAVRDGLLGVVADPDDPSSIMAAVQEVLGRTAREVPAGLAYFSFDRFQQRWHRVLTQVFGKNGHPAPPVPAAHSQANGSPAFTEQRA